MVGGSAADHGDFEPEEFDPMAPAAEPALDTTAPPMLQTGPLPGTEFDFSWFDDEPAPARPADLADLRPAAIVTVEVGELDPRSPQAGLGSEFVTGEFDPFRGEVSDVAGAPPAAIDLVDVEEVSELDLASPEEPPDDDEGFEPGGEAEPATGRKPRGSFGAGLDEFAPPRGGLRPRLAEPMASADKPSVDLAQFAAEMDQLAAELEAVVARRPPSGSTVERGADGPAQPAVVSPSLQTRSPPLAAPLELADDSTLEPDWGAAQASTRHPDSSTWDPFTDDLFERDGDSDDRLSVLEEVSLRSELERAAARSQIELTGPEDITSLPFDAAPLDTAPLDTVPLNVDTVPALLLDTPGSMPALADTGPSDEISPRLTNAHEALDLGDLDDAGDLDIDADAIDVNPRQQHASQTLWTGPAIAEPFCTGEHLVSTPSAEFSADVGALLQDDPEQLSAVREFFRTIDKTIRVYNLYEGKGKPVARALTTAYRELSELLERYPRVALRVTPYEFMLGDDPVYTSEEDKRGLTYQLFRDGVRDLTFARGMTEQELSGVLDVLRRTQRSDEDDSVTLLWQLDLQHVEYHAIDVFLEGMVETGSGDPAQAAIDALVELASQPLHTQKSLQVTNRSLKPLPAELVQHLAQAAADDDPAGIREALRSAESDLLRRSMWIWLKMGEDPAAEASVVKLLASILEEMLDKGRWQHLAAASEAIVEIRRSGATALLDRALAQVMAGDRLIGFAEVFELAASAEVPAIISFLQLSPAEANTSLLTILSRLPAGALETKLAELLQERGVDLTVYYRGRLKSTTAAVVISAIRALSRLSEEGATQAIHGQLSHDNWRIVLAAITALEQRIEKPSPELVSCLLSESHQVRDKALGLLAELPSEEESGQALASVVLESEKERWTDKQKKAASQVLVRWGGAAVDEQLIQVLTQGNPFRRRRVEDRRQEIFEAVQVVGGDRARALLTTCLSRKPPAAVRKGME
ncbi:MAG: hypothetical protein CSA65_00040, partial [Proteobacteria bacterium]